MTVPRPNPYRSSVDRDWNSFRDQFRKFLARDLAPNAENGFREMWTVPLAWLARWARLLPSVPEALAGCGATFFAYDAPFSRTFKASVPDAMGASPVHQRNLAHYILNYGQRTETPLAAGHGHVAI